MVNHILRVKKIAGAFMLASCISLLPGQVLYAQTIPANEFDAEYYAQNNPDVAAVFGNDAKALYQHYVTTGEAEHRKARKMPPNRLQYLNLRNFDAARYLADYPDLAVVGSNPKSLFAHYQMSGMKEGRKAYAKDDKTNAILRCFDVVDQVTHDGMSDTQKARAVHDWLCRNVSYDHRFQRHSYSLAGPMLYGDSVCEGYARAFEMMMGICGIPCEVVSGVADNGVSSGGHAWNKIQIDGQTSYIDVTWDDFTEDYGCIVYFCFMISESEMRRIHSGTSCHFMGSEPLGYY